MKNLITQFEKFTVTPEVKQELFFSYTKPLIDRLFDVIKKSEYNSIEEFFNDNPDAVGTVCKWIKEETGIDCNDLTSAMKACGKYITIEQFLRKNPEIITEILRWIDSVASNNESASNKK